VEERRPAACRVALLLSSPGWEPVNLTGDYLWREALVVDRA